MLAKDNQLIMDDLSKIFRLVHKKLTFSKKVLGKYKNISGYTPYQQAISFVEKYAIYCQLQVEILFNQGLTNDRSFFPNLISMVLLKLITDQGVKPVWLSPSLYEAFNLSSLPEKLPTIERPIKSGLLFFPQKKDYEYSNILDNPSFGLFYHFKKTDLVDSLSPEYKAYMHFLSDMIHVADEMVYLLVCFLEKNGKMKFSYLNIPLKKHETLDYSLNVQQFVPDSSILPEKIQDNPIEYTNKLKSTLIQTLIYLNNLPPQESAKYLASPQSSGGKYSSNHSVLTPLILGENFRIKTESQKSLEPALVSAGGGFQGGGSHASPAPHWRRGHYRMQPYGSRENPSYKPIWIEPMMINFH